jgi:hypothetical protein
MHIVEFCVLHCNNKVIVLREIQYNNEDNEYYEDKESR